MPGPLKGVKILDFSALLPGPFATMMMADLGADVLKVESPNRPDMVRFIPPFDRGESACHHALNRNKRSIAIDLKHPEGAGVVGRLVKTYDVLLEQFRPGVMERLGIGYETLRAENERLIYCSLTGYGRTGPYRDRAGHDMNYLSMAGLMSFCGRAKTGPVPQGVQIADIGCGSYNAVVGILAAVICRDRTGEGQQVDISMTDGAIGWSTFHATRYLVGGEVPGPETEYLNGGSFYDYYRTRDGRYMSVGSIEPKFFAALCTGIGREDLVDKVPMEHKGGEAWRELKEAITAAFVEKSQAEWIEIFAGLDACVEPVLTLEEMARHPLTEARNMVVDVPGPDGAAQRQIGSPFKFSATEAEYRHQGVKLGEHTDECLAEAGFTKEEIRRLRDDGVFG